MSHSTKFRTIGCCPFGLKFFHRFPFPFVALFVFVSFLPGFMTVCAERISYPSVISNKYFATTVDVARLRHEQVTIAQLPPVR